MQPPPSSDSPRPDRTQGRASTSQGLAQRACTPSWLALGALLLIGGGLLFANYGSGWFYRWDEGLYGQFARNALFYHDYTIPLGPDGQYASEPFSKPPLSFLVVAASFAVLGPTLYALRLPFTLATLGLACVCYAWGKALAPGKQGIALGFTWGVGVLMTTASLRWGRYAAIEPLFVLFMLLALWLHVRSLGARGGFATWGAGLALMLAFFTKQLAFGLALVPMTVLELSRLRQSGARSCLTRLATLTAPTIVFGGLWAHRAYQQGGSKFSSMLLDFAIKQRLEGFSGKIHFNHLNRVSRMLDEVTEPFSWSLGALGFGLFVLAANHNAAPAVAPSASNTGRHDATPADEEARPDVAQSGLPPAAHEMRGRGTAALLGMFVLTCTLVFENTSKSTLPWYTYSFIPPLMLGNAWLVVGSFSLLARKGWLTLPTSQTWLDVARAGLGIAVLVLAVERSLLPLGSQLDGVLGLVGALCLLGFVARRSARLGEALHSRKILGLLAGSSLGFLLLCRMAHEEFQQEPGAMGQLMTALARSDAQRVAIDTEIRKQDPKYYEPITLFGTTATITDAPWRQTDPTAFDAYVQLTPEPNEMQPPPGVELFRTAGAVLWSGDLARPPSTLEQLAGLLEGGPLTFEAEHHRSDSLLSLESDHLASGGKARTYSPWLSSIKKDHAVSKVTVGELPAGDYVAVFYVRYHCGPFKPARVGTLKVGGARGARDFDLPCKDPDPLSQYLPFAVPFSVHAVSRPELKVMYRKGRGALWHDKTEIWRAELWNDR